MFICDYHTHTCFSFDGYKSSTPDSLCRSAIEKNISDIAITDHFECNFTDGSHYPPYDCNSAYDAICAAREKYSDKINLTYGIEIGQANQCPKEAEKLLKAKNFEFVIASLHNLTNQPDFYYIDFSKLDDNRQIGIWFDQYINELSAIVDTVEQIDTIGHLTYMQRYIALCGKQYDFTRHYEKLSDFFDKIIKRKIALEVNVSTLSKGLGFAMPDKSILLLYKDCGGKLITLGSDAHTPEGLGKCIQDGFNLIRCVGLDEVTVVRNGRKVQIKI